MLEKICKHNREYVCIYVCVCVHVRGGRNAGCVVIYATWRNITEGNLARATRNAFPIDRAECRNLQGDPGNDTRPTRRFRRGGRRGATSTFLLHFCQLTSVSRLYSLGDTLWSTVPVKRVKHAFPIGSGEHGRWRVMNGKAREEGYTYIQLHKVRITWKEYIHV